MFRLITRVEFCRACFLGCRGRPIGRTATSAAALGRSNRTSADLIADKLLVAATLFMLVAKGRLLAQWALLPALVILCREILVLGSREYLAELRVGSKLGQVEDRNQMVAVWVLIVGKAGPAFLPVVLNGEFAAC